MIEKINILLQLQDIIDRLTRMGEFAGGRKYQRQKEKSGKIQVFISLYTENGCTDLDYRVSVDICIPDFPNDGKQHVSICERWRLLYLLPVRQDLSE